MKKFLCVLLSLVMLLSLIPMGVFATEKSTFVDVANEQYYYDAVMWAAENGITGGTSANTFSPDSICTRTQVVTFLHRMIASPEPAAIDMPFVDVAENAFYYKPVKWALGSNITGGTSANTFSPDDNCTRAQVVTFLWRTAGQPNPIEKNNPFTDVKADSYYYDAVLWAVENGITGGTSDTAFSPDSNCTRAQVVTFLYRFINAPLIESEVIEVDSVKELFDSIKPDANIVIKAGYYNLSEYAETVWENEGESFNDSHPYMKIKKCFDGVEIVIERADGISIKGGGTAADTEIVTQPRYAAVLNFSDCHDITLASLTMGHTDTGDCAGNVVNFTACDNINLSDMDIYGCGVYGIGAYEGTDKLFVYDSTVRDCFSGPLEITSCSGRFNFYDSVFNGNGRYSYIESNPDMKISFYRCEFGEKETEYFMFSKDVYTEDCSFSEDIEVYPEYGYDVELPDFTNMKTVPFDAEVIAGTAWSGVYAVVPENEDSFYLPHIGDDGREITVSVKINDDGTGVMNYYGEIKSFKWQCDSKYSLRIEMENEFVSGMLYTENIEGENPLWLLLNIDETAIWMRPDGIAL